MATENNIYEKYSDEELRLMLAIGLQDDNEKAASSFMHFVKKVWPGHTTIIFNSNDNVPCHLKAYDSTIAVRVSNHKPIVNLLSLFKNLMVSTSANISNLPTPKKLEDIAKIFPDPDVAFYYFENGESKKPSSIIDLNTMNYIRE